MTLKLLTHVAASAIVLGFVASAAVPAQADGLPVASAYGTGAYVAGYEYGLDSASDGGDLSFTASQVLTRSASNGDGYTSYASASLADGTLHASALAIKSGPNDPYSEHNSLNASATASMWDTVHWLGPKGGPLEAATLVPLELAIDGSLHGAASAKARVYFGYDADYDIASLPWINLPNGSTTVLDNLFIPLLPDPMYVFVQLEVDASGGNGLVGSADFSHTLHMYWDIPEGVTAVTASGAALQPLPAVSAAPEPVSWALMIVGVFGAGAMLRRTRAQVPA